MANRSNYDKFPSVSVSPSSSACQVGWPSIAGAISHSVSTHHSVVCIEFYPGVIAKQIDALAVLINPVSIIRAELLFKSARCIEQMVEQFLGDDPVFGRMNGITIEDYFDPSKL